MLRNAVVARTVAMQARTAAPQLGTAKKFFCASAQRPASTAVTARRVRVRCSAGAGGPAPGSLQGAELIELAPGVAPLLSSAPGVYAVYDKTGAVAYIGMSRKVSASIALNMQDVPELCHSVKIKGGVREELQAAWKEWVEEYAAASGDFPVGNSTDKRWTQRRAPPAKPEIRLTSGKGIQDVTVPLSTLIQAVVTSNKVVAFIKGTRAAPECGFSQRLVGILGEIGAEYEVVNVLDAVHNPGLREAIKEYSQWPTIPQLYVRGEFVGGSDIVAEMHGSGELAPKIVGGAAAGGR